MTCREFKHIAASLSLREFAQRQDAESLTHIQNCAACEHWMEQQRSLNASMHALRSRTAGLEAGPDVERALLRMFRQGIPVANAGMATSELAVVAGTCVLAGVKERKSQAAPSSTPLALRLSRFFEVGAYAAVAAAIVIALLLALHLLWQGHNASPLQGKSTPAVNIPAVSVSGQSSETASISRGNLVPERRTSAESPHLAATRRHERQRSPASASAAVAADDSQNDGDAGYMALMFCDPLSCASDTQVVRMELPSSEGAQPETADVVVGYDGVVRAVRFVN